MTIRIPGPFQQVSVADETEIVSTKGDLTHTDEAKIFVNTGSKLRVVDQLGLPRVLTVAQVTGKESGAPHVVFISDDGRPATAFYGVGRDKWINILDGLEVSA